MDLFGKVMSLLFNMLSRLVIAFLPRSKHILISWLQSPSADLPYPGTEPGSPALQTDSLLLSHQGSPRIGGFHEKTGEDGEKARADSSPKWVLRPAVVAGGMWS